MVWFGDDMFVYFGTIGMTWGAGNAIGHRVVDAVMGPRTIKHETVVSEAAAPASAPPVANMAFASCNPFALSAAT